MSVYKTAEIAALVGIHPNTVRLYEELGLIPRPERAPNGYRIFTELHLEQLRLARIALQIEVLQNGLRAKIIHMVKVSAAGDYDAALTLTEEYITQLQKERNDAQDAVIQVREICSRTPLQNHLLLKRKEVSMLLGISMDTLRNWEMNGLLSIRRKENGFRIYTEDDIRRLKIIRSLRCANYSLEAILHMLVQLSENPDVDILQALDTPKEDTDIIAVCDRLITSLSAAETNAYKILTLLQSMKQKYS